MEQEIALLTICNGFAGLFLYVMVNCFYAAIGIVVLCFAKLIKIVAVVFHLFNCKYGPCKNLQMTDQALIKHRIGRDLIRKGLSDDGEYIPDHARCFYRYHHLLIDAGVDDVERDETNFVLGYRHLQITPNDTYR